MAKRQSLDLAYMHHGAPIPMGSKIGSIVFSSAIGGHDEKTGKTPEDPDEQAAAMFANIRNFMEVAGGTPDDIIKVTLLLKENQYRAAVDKEWVKMFPDEHSRPARHAEIPNRLAQGFFAVEIIAVVDH